MPEMMPILFIGFVALIIVMAIVGAAQAKKRREAMAAWATSHGLSFTRDRDHSFDERYPEFGCLKSGSNRYAYNIMTGVWEGRAVTAFDYHYETHSTDSKGNRKTTHHHFSAVILRANIPLKPLVIRPEHFFDKIAGAFGFDDIDFESAEFSRKFMVKSPDRKWAYDVLHARAMEYLLAHSNYNIEFDTTNVIAARSGTYTPEKFEHAIRTIDALLDMLPDYVRQQQTSTMG